MKHVKTTTAAIFVASGLVLTGCGGGGGGPASSGSGGNTPAVTGQPITIDSTGLVPILSGGSTTTVVYVHNNTDHIISGIQYSSENNVASSGNSLFAATKSFLATLFHFSASGSDFLHSSATAACSTIAANGSCALTFTTPYLTPVQRGGSAVIRAVYQDNNKTLYASQVINFSYSSNINAKGVILASGDDLSSYGNKQDYATIYAYVPANTGTHYTVKNIGFSNKNFQISSNNLTGVDLAPGVVQAIEVKSFTPNVSLATKMTIDSTPADGSPSVENDVGLGALSPDSGPVLVSSIVPLFDVGKDKTAKIFVTNIGSSSVNVSAKSSNSHVALSDPGTINPGATVTVTATIDTSEAGNAVITFSGGVGTTAASGLAWYNQKPYLLIEVTPQYDTKVHEGFSSQASQETVTVTNLGSQSGTINSAVLSSVDGLVKESSVTDNCSGKTLNAQESCTVIFGAELSDPAAAQTGTADTLSGYLKLSISSTAESVIGLYGYTFTSNNTPVINGVATPDKLVLTNNNTQTKELKMVWTNYSAQATGTLTFTPPSLPAYFGMVNNGCTSPLAKNESCTVTYTVGPVPTDTAVASTSYQFSVADATHSVTSPVLATVQIESENIVPPPVVCPPGDTDTSCGGNVNPVGPVTPSTPESGTSGHSFVFYGGTTGNKYITFPVKNPGETYTIIGVKTDSLPPQQWQLDLGNTLDANNCLSGSTNINVNYQLDTNESCDLVFVNQYALNGNKAIQSDNQTSAVSAANISLPQLIVKSAAAGIYTLQPTYGTSGSTASETIYVNNSQAVVNSTISNDNTGEITFTYDTSNLLSNSYEAPNEISLHLQANNNESAGTSLFSLGNATGACVTDSNSTATCTLSSSAGSGTMAATLNPAIPSIVAESGIPVYVGSWLADFSVGSGEWVTNANPLAGGTLK